MRVDVYNLADGQLVKEVPDARIKPRDYWVNPVNMSCLPGFELKAKYREDTIDNLLAGTGNLGLSELGLTINGAVAFLRFRNGRRDDATYVTSLHHLPPSVNDSFEPGTPVSEVQRHLWVVTWPGTDELARLALAETVIDKQG